MTKIERFIPVMSILLLLSVCFAHSAWADDEHQPSLHVVNGQVFANTAEATAYAQQTALQSQQEQAIQGGYVAEVHFTDTDPGIRVGSPENLAKAALFDQEQAQWQANAARNAAETIRASQEFIARSRSIFNGQTDDRSSPIVKQAAIISTAQQAQFEASVKAQAEAQAKRILQEAKPIEYPKPRVLVAYEEKKEK